MNHFEILRVAHIGPPTIYTSQARPCYLQARFPYLLTVWPNAQHYELDSCFLFINLSVPCVQEWQDVTIMHRAIRRSENGEGVGGRYYGGQNLPLLDIGLTKNRK